MIPAARPLPAELRRSDGTVLVPHCTLASRLISRMVGLLNRDHLPDDEGLAITPCSSIHMFFMKFPIDVVWVSRQWQVLGVSEHVPPWALRAGPRGTYACIELPDGAVVRLGLTVGENLELRSVR